MKIVRREETARQTGEVITAVDMSLDENYKAH